MAPKKNSLVFFKVYLKLLRKSERFLNHWNQHSYPQVVTIRYFLLRGCKFKVTGSTDASRVEEYGDEEEFTRLILDEVQPGEVFYDIGASVGLVTVHAAKKGAYVVAFEPDPSFRDRLISNIELNRIENAKVIEWAVSDHEGSENLYTDGISGKSPNFLESRQRNMIRVPVKSIDYALKLGELAYPSIIKIDIEGAEIQAIKGMKNLFSSEKAPRCVFMELHTDFLRAFGSSASEVENLMKSFGYYQVYEKPRRTQIHCIFRLNLSA